MDANSLLTTGNIALVFNFVVLLASFQTNSKISELKVYIHENFVPKTKG